MQLPSPAAANLGHVVLAQSHAAHARLSQQLRNNNTATGLLIQAATFPMNDASAGLPGLGDAGQGSLRMQL